MKGALGILVLAALAYWPAGQAFFVKDDIVLISGAHLDFSTALFHSWPGGFVRHEAPENRVGCKDPPTGCRSSPLKLEAA